MSHADPSVILQCTILDLRRRLMRRRAAVGRCADALRSLRQRLGSVRGPLHAARMR